ncbi:MAG: DNA recombination protein RmuC [Candidatus Goldbacteria bacterium]|nr:DNA recombination protein RmuC [Candidatus Goldiibacteriota bacterium]
MLYILVGINIILLIIIIFLLFKNKNIDENKILQQMKESFQALSFNTLKEQTKIGEQTLEEKKKLIDQQLDLMRQELNKIQTYILSFDKDAKSNFESLIKQLQMNVEITSRLQETTSQLKEVLKSPKARGQWGERMAEDILNLAGFVENINYIKQKAASTGKKPDFTFILPKGKKVNMDVKFPFDNYLSYIETKSETEKEIYKKKFLSDVRDRIKEITTRDYINPDDNTVNYVILFIPNEQIYAFINETDNKIIDDALEKKVILCSPFTLYAILAVIRQAIENFSLEQAATDILNLMKQFYKQWDMFVNSFDALGKSIDDVNKKYNELITTRKNQLEKPLKEIDNLCKQKSIETSDKKLLE